MESFYGRKKGQHALKSYFVRYGVRSPPKFMVEILGSSFKFSTSTISSGVFLWPKNGAARFEILFCKLAYVCL